jgi:hypothetical protein
MFRKNNIPGKKQKAEQINTNVGDHGADQLNADSV